MRVVTLLPSATEIVASIEGIPFLVGRSHECNFPREVVKLPALTAAKTAFENSRQMHEAVIKTLKAGSGLYTVDADLLEKLQPDVIVTQSLCAVCSVDFNLVQRIAGTFEKRPVVVDLNPQSLEEVLEGCTKVGGALSLEKEAQGTVQQLRERVQHMQDVVKHSPLKTIPKVAFLEWTDPIFVGGHWTPELIHMAGASHPLNPPKGGDAGAGYSYTISNEDFVRSDPDWIIVCPCGLDIEETEKEMASIRVQEWWSSLRAVQMNHVVVVDGDQIFNRPGPRLVDALEWLVGLFHDRLDLIPASFPWKYMSH